MTSKSVAIALVVLFVLTAFVVWRQEKDWGSKPTEVRAVAQELERNLRSVRKGDLIVHRTGNYEEICLVRGAPYQGSNELSLTCGVGGELHSEQVVRLSRRGVRIVRRGDPGYVETLIQFVDKP